MSERYDYKPPLGFDIRVKPERRKTAQAKERVCAWPGCSARAEHKAPKDPRSLNTFIWLCTDHAREHNRAWNYFKDMPEEDVAAFQESAFHGHRPTWTMGVNSWTRKRAAAQERAKAFKPGEERPYFHTFTGSAFAQGADPFGLFGEDDAPQTRAEPGGPRRTRLQREALSRLGLEDDASLNDIKARYKELVKRFHPDTNGGDRSSEESLQRVIKAYQMLMASGIR